MPTLTGNVGMYLVHEICILVYWCIYTWRTCRIHNTYMPQCVSKGSNCIPCATGSKFKQCSRGHSQQAILMDSCGISTWFELDTQAPSLTAWGVKPRRGSITQEPSVTARRVLGTDVVSGLSICGPCTGQSRPSTSHLRQNLPTLCSWYVFHMYFVCNTHVQHMYSMY